MAILKLLDAPEEDPLRAIAVRAIAERFDPTLVDGLIARLREEKIVARRREYAEALTRVYQKPGPWVYWGYRPGPKPANTVAWERTEAIAEALGDVLADSDRAVRLAILRSMQREKVPVRPATLGKWLSEERDPERAAALLASLRDQPAAEIRPYLEVVIRDQQHTPANRQAALTHFAEGIDPAAAAPLLALAEAMEDGPVLADVLRLIGKYPKLAAAPLLARKLSSTKAEVRAAAIESLGELRAEQGREPLVALLKDSEVQVRRAAAAAAGKLEAKEATEPLLALAADADPAVRRGSLDSLRLLREQRAVPLAVAALGDRQTDLAAIALLKELGGPGQAQVLADLAKHNPSVDVSTAVVRALTAWRDRKGITAEHRKVTDATVAEIHGATGILVRWDTAGPLSTKDALAIAEAIALRGFDDGNWRFAARHGIASRACA